MAEMSERYLAHIWRTQRGLGGRVTTTEGQALRVVYPGRSNGHGGPDFCDAMVATAGGEVWRGDVELHMRSSYWRSHGHHRDPTYNGVALHVVMWHDDRGPTTVQSGQTVPVVALEGLLGTGPELGGEEGELCLAPSWGEPCRPGARVESLDALGDERFMLKAAQMEAALASHGAEEALYRGLMKALGYSRNEEPFRELAGRLPWRMLQGLVGGEEAAGRLLLLQALLLGTAGLLPGQRGLKRDAMTTEMARPLEEIWAHYGPGESMPSWQWSFFRVRPDNFPPRRIVAAGYLLARSLEKGLVETLLAPLEAASVREAQGGLERALTVGGDDYWSRHYDFGVAIGGGSKALIGSGRAREIAVNVVLPFAMAWGERGSRAQLPAAALAVFRAHPRLGDYRLLRQMGQHIWGKAAPAVTTARRQQGLLHLHRFYCREGYCGDCPLGS